MSNVSAAAAVAALALTDLCTSSGIYYTYVRMHSVFIYLFIMFDGVCIHTILVCLYVHFSTLFTHTDMYCE